MLGFKVNTVLMYVGTNFCDAILVLSKKASIKISHIHYTVRLLNNFDHIFADENVF